MILLADELVEGSSKKGGQLQIGGFPIRVVRNQYGRQIDSFEHALSGAVADVDRARTYSALFIRAPVVHTILDPERVRVIGTVPIVPAPAAAEALIPLGPHASAVALLCGKLMVTSYHPELTADLRTHLYWLNECVLSAA